jgi:hypothetical protein
VRPSGISNTIGSLVSCLSSASSLRCRLIVFIVPASITLRPAPTRLSKMINRNLYKRLERLEGRARVVTVPRFVVVNSGTPGGPTCVPGPDGRLVWWNPTEGCRVGELLEDSENPAVEMRVVLTVARTPTTVTGPDGRLVWLEPPEGSSAGEAIEDHPTKFICRRAFISGNNSSSRPRRERAEDPE